MEPEPHRSVTARAASRVLQVIPRERVTRLVGRVTEASVPQALLRPVLSLYSRAYRVNLDEAVVPVGGFRSFNEFFTRRLRDGVHAVDPAVDTVVSPADGRLDDEGPVHPDATFEVKAQTYDAATLLGDSAAAEKYSGGEYFVVYLSPRDYHRVHSPVEGRVRTVRHIPGTLFPVNELGVRNVPRLFSRNERVVVELDTEIGPVAVVLVGAFIVGMIRLAFEGVPRPPLEGEVLTRRYDPAEAPVLGRGAELGAFLLGSTVVVLLPPRAGGRWQPVSPVRPTPVRVGQAIVRWQPT